MSLQTLITGRACRLPGANDARAFAESLFAGRDLVTEIPRARWSHSAFLHPQPGVRGKSYTFAAGVLEDIWSFDASVFAISTREASQLDPQQRVLLQVVWEALEDAGLPPDRLAGQAVGVFVGASTMGYGARLAHDPMTADAYLMTGNTLSLVSNRISHALDLRGPSLTVDTACSSSLFALAMAQQAMERGEIDTAIVAGVNILLDPSHFVGFSAARMLSPTGRCRPFSAQADGYVRSEGAVALVLERKPVADILPRAAYAAILGVATNSDGRTVNVALPSMEGQRGLLAGLYEAAGIDPETLAFVEAHGTGTLAGDPIEATALGLALGRHRSTALPIGSVKSNIGHLEPASGVAGMLKALIAFDRRSYPRTVHAEDINTSIDWDGLNLKPVQESLPLRDEGVLRAGVSSFGFGGTNAHVILEQVEAAAAPELPAAEKEPPILLTSAASPESLSKLIGVWSDRLVAKAGAAADLAQEAAQASAFRSTLPLRAAVLCDDPGRAARAMAKVAGGQASPRVITGRSTLRDAPTAFIYSGNGSQYAGMGRAALASDKAYATAMRRIDRLFKGLSGWSIIEALNSPTLEQDLRDCTVAQPLLFADQIALTNALAARGFVPAAVMGHSGGEVAAACASGALSLDQALMLIHHRSLSQQTLRGRGAMAALSVSIQEAEESLVAFGGRIEIATENSPKHVTLVGTPEAIDSYVTFARREKRWVCVKLPIDYPYHASAQDEVLEKLAQSLAGLKCRAARIPFFSSVVGHAVRGEELTADYWCANVRQMVRFRDAMASLTEAGFVAFMEVGPAPVLSSYLTACLGNDVSNAVVLHSFEKQDTPDVNPVRRTLARALVHGARVAPGPLLPKPVRFDRDLPRYPWTTEIHRADVTPAIDAYFGSGADFHPMLGIRDAEDSASWRVDMDLGSLPEMADHRIGTDVLLPATGFAEMALLAAQRALKTDRIELRDLDIAAPLVLTMGNLVTMRVSALSAQSVISIESRARGGEAAWRDHMRGRFFAAQAVADPRRFEGGSPKPADVSGAAVYEAAREIGLNYGPGFRRLQHVRCVSQDRVEVVLAPGEAFHARDAGFALDVIGADAVFHGIVGAMMMSPRFGGQWAYVPVRIGRLILSQPGIWIVSGDIAIRRVGQRTLLADLTFFDAAGDEIARMDGVRFQVASRLRGLNLSQHAFRMETVPISEPVSTPVLTLTEALDLARAVNLTPEDDAFFFLEGVAQRVAQEGAAALCDAAGCIRFADMAGPDELHSGRAAIGALAPTAYAAAILGILERAELAHRSDAGWQLVMAEDDIPPVESLLRVLLADRPDLGPEAALLARLSEVLSELMCTSQTDAEATFGRGALLNYFEGSIFMERRQSFLTALVQKLAARWPEGRALRIAEVSDGRAQLLPRLLALEEMKAAAFYDVQADCFGDPAAGQSLPPDRVEVVGATVEALADAPLFHVILIPATLGKARNPDELVKRLIGRLAPGGRIIALEPRPSDFGDLVLGLDRDWFADVPGLDTPVSRLMGAEDLLRIVRKAGLETAQVAEMPDGLGGATLLVAEGAQTSRLPVGSAPLRAAIRTVVMDEPFDGGGEQSVAEPAPGPVKDTGAGLRCMRPEGQENVVVLWFDPACTTQPAERIAARLLFLRDLFEGAKGNLARMIAIVPGGSGQALAGRVLPEQTAIWAALRSAQNEYPRFRVFCIDPVPELTGANLVNRIAGIVAQGHGDTELVLTTDAAHGLRLMQGLPVVAAPSGGDQRAVLSAPVWSGIDEIAWHSRPRSAPQEGEIEVEVVATGLNYRDVMWAMGLLPEEALEKGFAGPTIGIECAGRVVAVGPGQTGFAIGDKVAVFGPNSFASHVTVAADLAARMPDDMDLCAAATLPVAFFTAHYALVHLAQLSVGETVLIHSGAGGVGLAAIQIALARGARVIATAGSGVKRAVLSRMGVPHVLDSRSLAFADEVMRLTEGRGADVVLNSLAGKAMEASLFCTAPFGRFIELGKQDFYANTAVGLRPMKENIAYFGVDVDQLIMGRPDLFRRLFAEMMQGFASGTLRPLPFRAFDGEAAVEAFRLMQKSGHLGKIVVRPRDPGSLPQSQNVARFAADPAGVHVIVGGMGGLGIEIARWLVRRGARKLVLLGRTANPEGEVADWIARCKVKGVSVEATACDVADEAALRAVLDSIREKAAIAGIVHSAMLLHDMPMKDLTQAVLEQSLAAKVTGGANLDRLTRQDDLGYFVVISSVAALIGNHGQSAYVAANAYLEGVARARREVGLCGVALGLGAIGDVGYLTRDNGKAALVKRMSGNVQMSARDVTATLDRLLQDGALSDPVVHVTPMRWGATSAALKTMSGLSFRLLRNLGRREGEGADTESLRDVLIGLPRAKAEERLSAFLVGRIAHILHVSEKTISIRRPITELGMDSLMGVELGLTLQESLGSDLPVTAISDGLSIAQIADRIVTHLHEESGTESTLSAHQSANQSLIKQHLNSDTAPRPVATGAATASIAPFRPVAAKTAKQGFPA